MEKQFVSIALGWTQRKKWTELDAKADTLQAIKKPVLGDDERLMHLLNEREKAAVEEAMEMMEKET